MALKPPPLPRKVFDYAPRPVNPPSLAEALWLCGPGLICWTIYLALPLFSNLPHPYDREGHDIVLILLPVAITTGIVSVWIYARPLEAKPWFLYLNLAVNVSGLFFAASQIVGFLSH